jgi:hypothetical protein
MKFIFNVNILSVILSIFFGYTELVIDTEIIILVIFGIIA